MTVMLTGAATVPHFTDCPTWCDQYEDGHDPYGEVGHHNGVELLAPRLHEIEIARVQSAALHHGHHVTVAVSVFREDHGTYNGDPETGEPTAEVGVFEHHGHSVVYRPTATELRAAAAAYTAAADLLDGTSR